MKLKNILLGLAILFSVQHTQTGILSNIKQKINNNSDYLTAFISVLSILPIIKMAMSSEATANFHLNDGKEIVELLIQNGTNLNAKNVNAMTWAIEHNKEDISLLFELNKK